MPKPTATQKRNRRRRRLKASGVTYNTADFRWVCKHTERVNIVAEGDSWFSYPREHLLFGPHANLLDWVANSISGSGKANLLRLAASGDEAVEMLAGSQKHRLAQVLQENEGRIRFILFSGGGNDVVGKWDMERLLNDWRPGFSAAQCINQARLERKLTQVQLAYRELLELRDEYAPGADIVTHTYDYVWPGKRPAKFLAGLIARGPWIYPYLLDKGVPRELHLEVISGLLSQLSATLLQVQALPAKRAAFHVVNTQGTLRPGHKTDWRDEIHPSSSGFRRLADKFYAQLRELEPRLPGFKR